MPKYNVPVQPLPYRQVNDDSRFTEAFQSQEEKVAQILFGEDGMFGFPKTARMFTRNENGTFSEINNEDDDLSASFLTRAARVNNLFVVDQNNDMRQLSLEENNGKINITVSQPVKTFELPARPTFWTILSPSSPRLPGTRSRHTRKRKNSTMPSKF